MGTLWAGRIKSAVILLFIIIKYFMPKFQRLRQRELSLNHFKSILAIQISVNGAAQIAACRIFSGTTIN